MSPVLLSQVNPPRAAELAQLIRLHTAGAENWSDALDSADLTQVQALATAVIAETSLVAMYRAELNSLGH